MLVRCGVLVALVSACTYMLPVSGTDMREFRLGSDPLV
jgi:hypothetical protein